MWSKCRDQFPVYLELGQMRELECGLARTILFPRCSALDFCARVVFCGADTSIRFYFANV